MSQGTVKKRGSAPDNDFRGQASSPRRWGVRFYALAVSIFVHVVALSIFAGIKLSQPQVTSQKTAAVVSISQVKQLTQTPVAAPKPKISSIQQRGNRVIEKLDSRSRKGWQTPFRGNDIRRQDLQKSVVKDSIEDNFQVYKPADEKPSSPQVEFFESVTQGRRICYVVDCSGSMQGLWGLVKAEICKSIGQLQPDQYFSVIIFGGGSILESGGGRLTRATEQAKKDAYAFIAKVQPRGATNAFAALEYAVKIHDASGVGPPVIYFLTDGFELNKQDNTRFAHQVATMRNSVSAQTKINTIGFWPDERDKKLLEMIAKESGGRFTLVGQAGEK